MNHRSWHDFYDEGVPRAPAFENVLLADCLARSATSFPDRPAIIFMNRQMSYRELKEHVDRFATALSALGVTKGSKVAIQLPNLPQTVIAYLGTLSLGGQAVMTNPLYTAREIEHQWHDADCTVAVVADFLFAGRIRDVRERLPVRHYIIASIPDYLRFPLNLLAPLKLRRADPSLIAKVQYSSSVHRMTTLIGQTAPSPPDVAVSMDDVAVLQYTGGTTGVSKGAMLSHGNLSYNVQQIEGWFANIQPGREVWLGCLPFFHVFGLTVSLGFPIRAGGAIVLMPNPRDIPQMIKNITRHRVTIFPGVPAMFNAINNLEAARKADLTSVKYCVSGSAPLPTDVGQRFEARTGAKIVEGFGLTEASPVTHCTPLQGKRKVGSIGLPIPGTDARVVDLETGTVEQPLNEPGELVIKGPQVMQGYWNKPHETAQTIVDGWLRTGDIATVDEEGYFQIVGRKKDMIVASGYKIYPDEVDDVLMSHPAVLEVATIGVPDERRGETIKSFVVLQPHDKTSAEDLIEFSRSQLAAYKIPREIEFRSELPKSTVLKILRRELRDEEIRNRQKGQERQ